MNSNFNFWQAFFRLLHMYAGVFIAPFIFIAALSGLFYAATPQIEQFIYKDVLYIEQSHLKIHPLSQQIEKAKQLLSPTAQITEVRPSPAVNQTTRIIFSDSELELNNEAIFIDPYTLEVKGQLAVYGTSGLLPFRTRLDHLHRDLLLGSWGRFYSELAASWLAILIFTGFFQWYKRHNTVGKNKTNQNNYIKKHSTIGLVLFPLLLFVAVTGLTWSEYAGENIRIFRQTLSWQTPVLATSIKAESTSRMIMHHEDHSMVHNDAPVQVTSSDFDIALDLARKYGIDAAQIQIKPPLDKDQAWSISEIQLHWPTQADRIAIDISNHRVIDKLYFDDYPLIAKLTRWGVDAHIGILFGWINQLILIIYSLALCVMILYAYLAWYKKTNFKQTVIQFSNLFLSVWTNSNMLQRVTLGTILIIFGVLLPLFGFSLIVGLVAIFIGSINERKA
ncbi:PepSY domain-containing protein [Acinetobacter sp. 1207_04]|uniref:PepSY-associated TM helix domain-containing protein n=1 Tax=Acinetobacter sp. 1207_04 TaxID=2604449 RepID=UPI00405A3C5A